MCLATVYKESDDSVIFKNVSRIDVDGNKLVLRDIMGDERVVEGRILMVDLANSIVKLTVNNFFKSELLNCGFINFINAELEQEALYYYGTRNCCRRKRRRW